MSFTTYREQQGTYASSHCRSEVLHTINTKQGRAQRSRASVKRTLSTRDKIFDVGGIDSCCNVVRCFGWLIACAFCYVRLFCCAG